MNVKQQFRKACQLGNLDIVKSMIENRDIDINDGFVCACYDGKINVLKFMIDKCDTNSLNFGLGQACLFENIDAVELLLENGVTHPHALYDSCKYGRYKTIRYLVKKKGFVFSNRHKGFSKRLNDYIWEQKKPCFLIYYKSDINLNKDIICHISEFL